MTADGQGKVGGRVHHRRLRPPDALQVVPEVCPLGAAQLALEGGFGSLLTLDAGLDLVLLLHQGGHGGSNQTKFSVHHSPCAEHHQNN